MLYHPTKKVVNLVHSKNKVGTVWFPTFTLKKKCHLNFTLFRISKICIQLMKIRWHFCLKVKMKPAKEKNNFLKVNKPLDLLWVGNTIFLDIMIIFLNLDRIKKDKILLNICAILVDKYQPWTAFLRLFRNDSWTWEI